MKRDKPPVAAQGFEQEWRGAMSDGMDALTGQMQRGGGQQVVQGLDNANEAYRNMKVLGRCRQPRWRADHPTGENYLFSASQLQRAGQKAQTKYPGAKPFEQLADNGQSILPSVVPDSGTAGRMALLLAAVLRLPGLALVPWVAARKALRLGAFPVQRWRRYLLLVARRPVRGLSERPCSAGRKHRRRLRDLSAKIAGLFGSATIPLMLGSQ
ncbi:hypothetical protein [Croceicoccus sp. Ery15]|uniref:hypothetical protein n=1 Tax=Croceicoccus sp. Ery15 TaxID=1703338 RepID=UPI001E2BA69A|nr:hypothetical protein [Croceicoccus sp. Ery15]